MKYCLWVLLLCSAFAASSYQTGKLVSVEDSRHAHIIGNGDSIQTVTKTEYRISVKIGDLLYVCSYRPHFHSASAMSDFIVNDDVEVRIDGKNVYLKRPDGKEVKTALVSRERLPQP